MYFRVLKEYYKNLFSSPIKVLGVLLVVIIALCFGFVMVVSYSLVPDAVADMPTAVVNHDKGTADNNYGDELIEKLKDNDAANWQFIDEDELDKGIENTKYLAAFEIPEDFSKKIENKQQADLIVHKNMRKNFIYAQLFKVVQTEMKNMVSASITEKYGKGAFEALDDVKDGMAEAADGSQQIEDGIDQVQTGANSLASGSKSLAKGADQVSNGADKLAAGSKKLAKGTSDLSDGAKSVNKGASDLQAGIDKLDKSVNNINVDDITLTQAQKDQISGGAIEATKTYADQLSAGIGQAVASTIKGKLTSDPAKEAAKSSALNNSNVQALIGAAAASGMMSEDQAKAIVAGVATGTLDVAAGSISGDEITAAISPTIAGTIKEVSSGVALNTADQVIATVNAQLSETIASMKTQLTSATGQLNAGAKQLKNGTSQVKAGAATVSESTATLSEKTQTLAAGAGQVSEGAGQVKNGAGKLASGIPELASGANTLTSALNEGEEDLSVNLTLSSDYMGEYIASPIGTEDKIYGIANSYGEGIIPLFLSLALWLGALIIYIMLPSQPEGELQKRRFSNVLGTWTFMGTIGFVEAIAISIGALIFGMTPFNTVVLFVFAMIASLTFMAVVNCFVQLMGLGGSALCVILTIFQIAACEGTFPAGVMPKFYGTIKPFLPMNYTIDGFREIFFGESVANLGSDILALACFMAIFILIDILLIKAMTPRREYIAKELGR